MVLPSRTCWILFLSSLAILLVCNTVCTWIIIIFSNFVNVVSGRQNSSHKNPIKDRWPEPSQGRQKGRPKKGQKTYSPAGTKKRERASPFHGRKLSHS
jgi:hypothetical protein